MATVSSTSKGSEHVSEPIKYKVVSIDEMLDAKYWQAPEDIVDEKLCSRGFENTLPVWRNYIQQALKAYAGYLQAPSPTGFIFNCNIMVWFICNLMTYIYTCIMDIDNINTLTVSKILLPAIPCPGHQRLLHSRNPLMGVQLIMDHGKLEVPRTQ